jgi:fucose 4-O-acetylase-like acetyltransferase
MPLLFLISGMGARYAMRTRSAAAFARARLARLLVPFAFGLVLLVPPMFYIEALGRHGAELVVHGRDAGRGAHRLRDLQRDKSRWTTFADIERNEFDLIAG